MASEPQEFEDFIVSFEKLTPEQRERLLVELRRRRNLNGSDKPPRSLSDALRARGIIGSIKDAPPDWSTNAEYMEGFGQDAE